jgi:hypothetical protein
MKIEVSIGEIVDKFTILSIKKIEIKDESKLINIDKEWKYLYDIVAELKIEDEDINKLMQINRILWNIENNKRDCERTKDFGDNFTQLARSVYIMNDKRAFIKKEINIKYKSDFYEEKSYKKY